MVDAITTSNTDYVSTTTVDVLTRAAWDAAYINGLPDSAFAVILPGGTKDDSGKTVPRDLRKLPHHDATGAIDLPHLRNALSREPQTDMSTAAHSTAAAHLDRHSTAAGVGAGAATRSDQDQSLIDEPPVDPAADPAADPAPAPAPDAPADAPAREDAPGDAPVDPDAEPVVDEPREVPVDPGDVQVRDAARREIDVRLVPWDTPIDTIQGREQFARGAFDDTNPDDVLLMGLEHEAQIGLGQDGRPTLVRRTVGRGIAIDPTVPRLTFRVARTAAGDELLALAADRIVRGVSVEFHEIPNGTSVGSVNGRRTRTHHRVRLSAASMTNRPAYGDQASVLAVRSSTAEGSDMPDQVVDTAATNGHDAFDPAAFLTAFDQRASSWDQRITDALERIDIRARMDFTVPTTADQEHRIERGEWTETVIKILTGDRVPDAQLRALADVITSDNAGVVPPTYLTELIGVIDTSRPFLSSTRKLPTPTSGMQMIVPVINQRPITAKQTTEKSEVATRKTLIGTESFDAVSIAGAGDISIQVLKRSSRSFLDLWLELLAEAYAIDCEDVSITALLAAMGGVGAANPMNPANLNLGAAFVASFDAIRRPPDTIWLSTEAVGEFIDAKATTTNQPLYPGLAASATAAGGITGVISGLRPVHVPALDAHGAYSIVGPSSGFAWAEDGTYTLQVDVPSKAGRDVGLIGMIWPAPWYPAAFTAWNVAS